MCQICHVCRCVLCNVCALQWKFSEIPKECIHFRNMSASLCQIWKLNFLINWSLTQQEKQQWFLQLVPWCTQFWCRWRCNYGGQHGECVQNAGRQVPLHTPPLHCGHFETKCWSIMMGSCKNLQIWKENHSPSYKNCTNCNYNNKNKFFISHFCSRLWTIVMNNKMRWYWCWFERQQTRSNHAPHCFLYSCSSIPLFTC